MPLAALLLLGAPAAPTAEQAARDARTAIERADFTAAQRLIDAALRRFGAQNDEATWSLRVMNAEVLQVRGLQEEARDALKDELPAALRTSVPAVRRLLTLGNVAVHLRDAKEATRRYKQAYAIASKAQPRMQAEVCAALALAASGITETEKYANQAILAASRDGLPKFEARAHAALQYRYMDAGRYSDSIQEGEKALAIARALGVERAIGQIEGNLGWAYIEIGDYETAGELFEDARAIAARIGSAEYVTWLNQLGNLRVQRRDWAGAERYYADALARARSTKHADLAFILANLANVALETGRLDAARRYNAEALALKREAKEEEPERRSLILDARIAAAQGDTAGAIATLNGVIKGATPATRWEARGRLAEVLARLNRDREADQQFRAALETVRETRNAIENRELRFSFYNVTAQIFSAYIDFLIARQRIKGALDATEMIRIDALDDALQVRSGLAAIDPRAIARQQGATILSYWLGPRQSYVWIVTPGAIRAAKLSAEEKISEEVNAYRRDLTGARAALSKERGERLYSMLGVRSIPRGARVIIVPDGALHSLSFDTLVTARRYWIEDVVTAEASSIGALARRNREQGGGGKLLLVGNPSQADPSFPPLPRANEEMASVGSHFQRPTLLAGAAANPAAYRAASPDAFDVIHFVAHGLATRKRPLESAVILGRDAGNRYKLLARDVLDQPLRARLVTISSCHGAGTRAYTGEGLVGLAWAFLRAGAGNVIAALWEVNDSATPQLMDRLYAKTAAGGDPAAALRDAKLSLLRSNSVYRSPRYWAPFVLYMR